MFSYEYPHPAVTVDVVAVRIHAGALQVHLVKRTVAPQSGTWALPGTFLDMHETLEQAAARVLRQKGAIECVTLRQLHAFSAPDRDPRERVISIGFIAVMSPENLQAGSGQWFAMDALPSLAFDHASIISHALSGLPSAIDHSPLPFAFLPPEFSLSEVQGVYETLAGVAFDKRNFMKKLRAVHSLEATGRNRVEGAHRPAKLYRYRN